MVRKVSTLLVCVALIACFASTAHATQYFYIDGNVPNNVVQYARDIVSGIDFNEHYLLASIVEGENDYCYVLAVGDVVYDSNHDRYLFYSGTLYIFDTYGYGELRCAKEVVPDTGAVQYEVWHKTYPNTLIYSDLNNNPQLLTIGDKHEILQTFTLCAVVLFALCVRIFGKR